MFLGRKVKILIHGTEYAYTFNKIYAALSDLSNDAYLTQDAKEYIRLNLTKFIKLDTESKNPNFLTQLPNLFSHREKDIQYVTKKFSSIDTPPNDTIKIYQFIKTNPNFARIGNKLISFLTGESNTNLTSVNENDIPKNISQNDIIKWFNLIHSLDPMNVNNEVVVGFALHLFGNQKKYEEMAPLLMRNGTLRANISSALAPQPLDKQMEATLAESKEGQEINLFGRRVRVRKKFKIFCSETVKKSETCSGAYYDYSNRYKFTASNKDKYLISFEDVDTTIYHESLDPLICELQKEGPKYQFIVEKLKSLQNGRFPDYNKEEFIELDTRDRNKLTALIEKHFNSQINTVVKTSLIRLRYNLLSNFQKSELFVFEFPEGVSVVSAEQCEMLNKLDPGSMAALGLINDNYVTDSLEINILSHSDKLMGYADLDTETSRLTVIYRENNQLVEYTFRLAKLPERFFA